MYRVKRASRDLIQPAAVRELTQLGYSVADCAALGEDFPDLVIGRCGIDQLVELKTYDRVKNGPVPADALLRPGQRAFRERWRGASVIVAYSAAEIHAQFVQRLLDLEIISRCST